MRSISKRKLELGGNEFMRIRNFWIGLTFLLSGAANAALINGSIEITGAFLPVDSGNNQVGLDVATGIDFTSDTGVVVDSAGGLSMAYLTLATMTDFQFLPALSPDPVTVWSAGGFSFSMNDVTVNNQTTTNLSLSGMGVVSGGAFDATSGTWELTANTAEGSSTFSWSSSTVTVIPVPPAVWLFGTGLIGLFGVARRRR
jgi:hypothetical protein